MRPGVLYLVIAVLSFFPHEAVPAMAQDDGCEVIVYYNEATGKNEGDCSTMDTVCQSWDYALEQGQRACPERVAVINADPNNTRQVVDWQPATDTSGVADTLLSVAGWVGPAAGLVLGWLVAWLLTRMGKGGAGR